MRVLLIVDVQRDFCPGGTLPVPNGDKIVPIVNQLIECGGFDLIVATKDWHPENHSSFASNNPGTNIYDKVIQNGVEQTLWPDHCVQHSLGSEFHPDLKSALIDKIIFKGTDWKVDSYSGFFDNAKDKETELRECLEGSARSQGVQVDEIELTVCGLATDYCVGFTALDAAKLGFRTELVLDASRAVNIQPDDELKMLRALTQAGVRITDSRSVLRERGFNIEPDPSLGRSQGLTPSA